MITIYLGYNELYTIFSYIYIYIYLLASLLVDKSFLQRSTLTIFVSINVPEVGELVSIA